MDKIKMDPPISVDDFITRQPEAYQQTLQELRAIILSVIPKAEEKISYQIPCFRYQNAAVVSLNANKKFCSLILMSPPLAAKMADELKALKMSGTTMHFFPGQPLPAELIKKVVLARVQENELRKKS